MEYTGSANVLLHLDEKVRNYPSTWMNEFRVFNPSLLIKPLERAIWAGSLCPCRVTYYVLEGLGDGQTGVPPFHNHGGLHVLCQLGRSALQEALGTLRLGFSEDKHTNKCKR